jgi:3,8-divinyl chlorophyllide a/chlorophyllide a reductase subunit Y
MTHPIIPITEQKIVKTAIEGDGMGCHSGGETLLAAAKAAGKSETLEQYAKDYPKNPDAGPHDQPQSMCPAFGSLRVGLRMRRTATILSGSACCVYGLTFTSHFYGARRSVGYVPFNSESLVTGKLFEDIRDSVHEQADPAKYDAIVIINLCVPTASGVPLQLLPKEINGVRIIGIDVPGFGVPTHAEAKDVLAHCAPEQTDYFIIGRDVSGGSDDYRFVARTNGLGSGRSCTNP